MSKQDTINEMITHIPKGSERYEKTKMYLECRTRPGEKKTVLCCHKKDGMDIGVQNGEVTLIGGKCPCSICGHEFMWECYEADCYCCSSVCT